MEENDDFIENEDSKLPNEDEPMQVSPWQHFRIIFLDLMQTGFTEKQALHIIGSIITAQVSKELG